MNTQSDTPETDAMIAADQHHLEEDNFFPATVYLRMCDVARTLERERNEWKALATQYSAEREHNAMQALAYKAERDEAIRQLAKLQDQIIMESDTKKPLRETSNKLT